MLFDRSPSRMVIPLSELDDDAREGVLNACIRDFCWLRGIGRSDILVREVLSTTGVETAEITVAVH